MIRNIELVLSDKKVLVLPVSNKRLPEMIGEVEGILRQDLLNGEIFFDLLVTVGLSSSRYVRAIVKDGFVLMNTLRTAESPPKDFVEKSNLFYLEKFDFVRCSFLPRSEKYRIENYLKRFSFVNA